MICMLYVVSCLLYMLCMLWAGRRLYYGPEGNMLWAGRRLCYGPEGVVLRTGRSGPGKAYVRKLYIGELTKHLCLQLLCMCFRY